MKTKSILIVLAITIAAVTTAGILTELSMSQTALAKPQYCYQRKTQSGHGIEFVCPGTDKQSFEFARSFDETALTPCHLQD